MRASVIIPNLNGAGWLRDSIESIWAQTEQDFELIVIDNGSTDESRENASELLSGAAEVRPAQHTLNSSRLHHSPPPCTRQISLQLSIR